MTAIWARPDIPSESTIRGHVVVTPTWSQKGFYTENG